MAVTAWNALTGDGTGVRPGDTVVVQGSGGVSLFALQFAKALGARVIATTGDPARTARLRELGADAVVDYTAAPTGRRGPRPHRRPGRRPRRRRRRTAPRVRPRRRPGGTIACVGFTGRTAPPLDPQALFASGATVRSVAVGSRAQFTAMNAFVEKHGLRPVVDRVFPFDRAVDAYRHHATGRPFGKVVVSHP
ncbi:zinc-binding dehydrogenase [Streptomyces diastatochromogenes]|nr:zinc-binding dehydrogenase [Streptomyces diastatochromogenes]